MGTGFQPFTLTHGLAVLISIAIWTCLIGLARRWQGTPRRTTLDRTMGWLSLALTVGQDVWWLLPQHFQLAKSLPLQLCDIVDLVLPLFWFFRWRKAFALVYFWGLAFSTQAFITPALAQGPASAAFWFFWATHAMIVGSACFSVTAGGFRPEWRDYGWAMGMATLYTCVMLPVNAHFGFNYGYIGDSLSANGGLANVLGPWPGRVFLMLAIAFVLNFLLLLPWLAPRFRNRPSSAVADAQPE